MVTRDDARQIGGAAEQERIIGDLNRRIVVDETDDAARKVVLAEDLLGDHARQPAGTHDKDVLFEMRIAREAFEREPPERNSDKQQPEGGQENAAADDHGRHQNRDNSQCDRGGAGGLQHADEQLGPRVHDRQVVQIVVIEAELAHRGDQHDLPQAAHRVVQRAVHLRRHEERSRDQHRFESEGRQSPCGDLTVEHLHARSSPWFVRYSASLSTTPSSLP